MGRAHVFGKDLAVKGACIEVDDGLFKRACLDGRHEREKQSERGESDEHAC